ncbi:barstar family protein [Streptomyces yaanensis]|uniref:Barstar family protein n=1 Tax=Streptomyces yaanensis TaxID=1142239 RepID=A0ABV7S4R0_9ACTN|nr:barstar family protein [Streptomyces sp. CGMCC 4.7035]WNC00639.1 barstar family protein [Streptomyces sp. CGMCC 4.7035]
MTDDLAAPLVVTLDLHGVADKAAFMERIVRALELPDWFGRNWDALADSLGDGSVWPADGVEKGLLLVVRGWQPYAKARPEEWEIAREVFAEAADRTPGLTVALALGGSHERPSDLPG